MGKIKWNCRELDSVRPVSKSKSLGLGSCHLSSTPDFKQLASADSFGDLDQSLASHLLYVYCMLWAEDSLPLRCSTQQVHVKDTKFELFGQIAGVPQMPFHALQGEQTRTKAYHLKASCSPESCLPTASSMCMLYAYVCRFYVQISFDVLGIPVITGPHLFA